MPAVSGRVLQYSQRHRRFKLFRVLLLYRVLDAMSDNQRK